MSIHIQLERFEGPLGLLLYLIRKEEMDIFDINIHHITRQYLEYIRQMRRLDLEVAGEFVALAATLIHIKSKMLLPQYGAEGEELEVEDPRRELVNRLLEYQKYQDASKGLYSRTLMGRDVFARGSRFKFDEVSSDDVVVEDNPLFALISCYRVALKAMKTGVHKVFAPLQTVAARILDLRDLILVGRKIIFGELIVKEDGERSGQVLVTFLALLELAKMGFVSLFQAETYADIHIEGKKPIEGDVISQVENYDSGLATQNAEQLLLQAELASQDEGDIAEAQLALTPAAVQAQPEPEMPEESATDEEILAEEQRLNLTDLNLAGAES